MNRWIRKQNRRFLLLGASLALSLATQAQEVAERAHVDFFLGAELNYRDIMHDKVYEWLINLTPGVKWQMGYHWQVAAQAIIPVVNDYGDRYKKVRLNVAALSKELYVSQRGFVKLSGGWFTDERYGLDAKTVWIVNDWLGFEAQAGLTGHVSMAGPKWESSKPRRLTALAGADVYLRPWNTQFRFRGGRYVMEDLGFSGDAMRHFTHCSVGLYGEYSNKGDWNAGFKIIVMVPPYKRKMRRVNFRPASCFTQTYNMWADVYQNRMYRTDPEENEREGWFDRSRLRWGSNLMEPDFRYVEQKGGAE